MLKIIVKTDKFAERMIKNGERAKRRALFGMASSARKELRNVVRKRKKPSVPGAPPRDHGTYRKTALFSVDSNSRGFSAGFADFKSSNKKLVLSGSTALAQDNLEFGATIRIKPKDVNKGLFPDVYKGRFYARKKKARKKFKGNAFVIQPRPHVFIAQQNLFDTKGKNGRNFKEAQQYLIDRGYLK
jgi:hypothetical protein